jgi:hypothetical protein
VIVRTTAIARTIPKTSVSDFRAMVSSRSQMDVARVGFKE